MQKRPDRTFSEMEELFARRHDRKPKEYHEKWALDILQYYFPKKFADMEKGECPDYSNKLVGLEVTRAMSEVEGNLSNFVDEYKGKSYNELPVPRLKKLGFKNEPVIEDNIFYVQSSSNNGKLRYIKNQSTGELNIHSYWTPVSDQKDTIAAICHSIATKIDKLSTHYTINKENDLAILNEEQLNFIGFEIEFTTAFMDNLMVEFERQFTTAKTMFDIIYIVCLDNLFVIDVSYRKIDRICIDKEIMIELSYVLSDGEQAIAYEIMKNHRQ